MIRVEMLNPASITLLEELEKLELIAIHKSGKAKKQSNDFSLIQKIRTKSNNLPSFEEIAIEAERQKAEMYSAVSTKENNRGYLIFG